MSVKETVQQLSAENAALQTLVVGLMHELVGQGRGDIARGAFDHADRALEMAVLALGERCPEDYSRHAMETLDQIRRMAFPGDYVSD